MQRDFYYARDINGNALAGVSLSFYSPGTTVPVTLYSPSSSLDTPTTTISNPVLTDVEGFASWAIPDGDYDVVIYGGTLTTRTITRLNYFDGSTFTLSGGGTTTSVALSMPTGFSVAGTPVTTSGTLAVSYGSVTGTAPAGKFLGSPVAGGAGTVAFRVLDTQDIPNLAATSITSGTLATARGGTGQSLTVIGQLPSQWGLPCKAVQVANINVSNPGTAVFDGVTVTTGQRILLTAQTTTHEMGPWVWNGAAVPLTRPEDFTSGSTTVGYEDRGWFVVGGTAYAGSFWRISTAGAITVNTTGLTITQCYLRSVGGTANQLVYLASTGYTTSSNLLFDGNTVTFGAVNPTPVAGMFYYDTTQKRFKGIVGTDYPVFMGGVIAAGTVTGAISTAGQATTLTALIGTTTIPANTLKAGSILRFTQFISAAGLSATPGFAIFFPASVVTAAIAATTTLTSVFKVEAMITVKTAGGAGTMEVQIYVMEVGAASAALTTAAVAAVAVDTTAAITFDHKITLTGVSAGSVTPRPYILELLS